MRVLVTRPELDAQGLAGIVRKLGHEPVVAPLLEIRPSDHPLPEDCAGRVLLFTSASGARLAGARGLAGACYAVGRATAEAARRAGFSVAGVAEGDSVALATLVAERLSAGARLLHVSGADVAGDLEKDLGARGFEVSRFIAYEAVGAATLPTAAATFFQGLAGAALLLSPRTAAILAQLTIAAGLQAQAGKHCALALSEAVASQAARLSWRDIKVAVRPTQEALLRLL